MYLIVPLLSFLISMIFDHKRFKNDMKTLIAKIKSRPISAENTTDAEPSAVIEASAVDTVSAAPTSDENANKELATV